MITGNLSTFLAMEEGYLAAYAASAGLHSSLVSTLSMEEIQVRCESYALSPQPSTHSPQPFTLNPQPSHLNPKP